MKRYLIVTLTLFTFLIINLNLFSAVGVNLRNGDIKQNDFSNGYIQTLIDQASSGDTVFIKSGIYYENVEIHKPITLVGEDKNTTIIDGMEQGSPLWIECSFVNISNFTIRNSPFTLFSEGIYVRQISQLLVTNISISNCIVENNDCGIRLENTTNAEISNCILKNNKGHSFYLLTSSHVNIRKCDIFENGYNLGSNYCVAGGIVLSTNDLSEYSDNVTISYCNIYKNIGYGILNLQSINTCIYHNNFFKNPINAYDEYYTGNNFYNDTNGIGNYWDNYIGRIFPRLFDLDKDGVGVFPYVLYQRSNKDYYPRMKPWSDINPPKLSISLDRSTNNIPSKIIDVYESHSINKNVFSPQDIEPKDDAFHDKKDSAEWWYFDTVLNDNYSIQAVIYIFTFFNTKIVMTELNIFKDGKSIVNKQKIYLKNDFFISSDSPLIIIDKKQVMKGYIDNRTGKWTYDVSLDMGDSSVDLQFVGCAKGWKGNLTISEWAAILPKANVNGTIKIKGEESKVSGQGYHDHNWNMKLRVYFNFGWYWGRIISANYSIVYYMVMNTRLSYSQMALLIANETTYTNIKTEDLNFLTDDFHLENMRFIPNNFLISANTQNISFLVELNALKLYHGGMTFGVRNYWRYFVKSQGYIKTNSEIEEINGMQIAEFWRFR